LGVLLCVHRPRGVTGIKEASVCQAKDIYREQNENLRRGQDSRKQPVFPGEKLGEGEEKGRTCQGVGEGHQ